jgi:hypothetical protein
MTAPHVLLVPDGSHQYHFCSSAESPCATRRNNYACWTLLIAAALFPLAWLSSSQWAWRDDATRLASTSVDSTVVTLQADEDDACIDKEHLLKIVAVAGVDLTDAQHKQSICRMMPTWKEVSSLYSDKPRIIGLETCQRYRDMLARENRTAEVPIYSMPRVAGLHNSGTNALADTMYENFERNPTIRVDNPRVYNIPWRKHTPWQFHENVTARFYDWKENKKHVLPVVVIRDPYRWMNSMCKVSYNVQWIRAAKHCPNVVAYPRAGDQALIPVNVSLFLDEPTLKTRVQWTSMAHMWNDWNRQYLEADVPRLIVRYEDTLYHAEHVFRAISECAGLPLKHDDFRPYIYKANAEGTEEQAVHSRDAVLNDLIVSLNKNGIYKDRYGNMIAEDIQYTKQHLDPELLDLFHYVNPSDIPAGSYAAYDLEQRASNHNNL